MDEAKKCIKIAEEALQSGDLGKAEKFAKKAHRIFPSETTTAFADKVARRVKSARAADAAEAAKREFTTKQLQEVNRVIAAKCYYEALQVSRLANEKEIRSAFKKKAFALHPDRNSAPRAEDAFKKINKAYELLSDAQKRAVYNTHGVDPSEAPGAQRVDPSTVFDELFRNMMFGGNNFTYATFGNFERSRSARRPAQGNNFNLLYLLLLAFSLYQMFGSLFFGSDSSSYSYSLTPTKYTPVAKVTAAHSVPYYVAGDFDKRYKVGGARRQQVEAEVDYTVFQNACQNALHPVFRELHYAERIKNAKMQEASRQKIRTMKATNSDCIAADAVRKQFPVQIMELENGNSPLSIFRQ